MGIAKPDPLFYRLTVTAAQCEPGELLFVGDNLDDDVSGPIAHGMRGAMVRPDGLRDGEQLPDGAWLIRHVSELPGLITPATDEGGAGDRNGPVVRTSWT